MEKVRIVGLEFLCAMRFRVEFEKSEAEGQMQKEKEVVCHLVICGMFCIQVNTSGNFSDIIFCFLCCRVFEFCLHEHICDIYICTLKGT